MVYGLDADSGKKLWQMQTVENIPNNGLISLQQVINNAEGNPEFVYWDQRTNIRFRVALGRIGAVQASYVAILGHKGLSVVDPLRGTVLWKKADVAINSHVFGDAQHVFVVEANDAGGFGAGRALRASDGEPINVPDFSSIYQARIRAAGRQILAAQTAQAKLTIRLYDILTGKDVWSKQFAAGTQILNTEDRNIAGVIEPNGMLTVLAADTGKVLVTRNLVKARITPADIKGVRDPLLLQDSERFYVALNQPIDPNKVAGGEIHNNFSNGTRCLRVNGWFAALHRHDGKRKFAGGEVAWKKGDLAWHSHLPVHNQMIVLEQFEQAPIVIFSARYNEMLKNGGNRWVSVTQSLQKSNGKMVYDSGPRGINGFSPMFSAFHLDPRTRTLNLLGFSGSVQHYIDDGKGPPALP
ncbi:MAG: hypothetical protein EXR98_06030 [Gemmataceae bacterium]|nr:hypothetical protein [Gemmataceae bacterium]